MKKMLVVFICAALFTLGTALNCYTCSFGPLDEDRTCVDAPENLTITNCNKKYCTLIRQDFKDPKDKLASIYRGCEDNPLHMNEIIEDETYRFYYTACQEALCNGGSGKLGIGSSSGALEDKDLIL